MDKHLDGAWDKFWIKSQNGTFIALQMKAFVKTKKIKFHAGVKKCYFGSFLEWAMMVSVAIKNP